jgi:hypothetical protein
MPHACPHARHGTADPRTGQQTTMILPTRLVALCIVGLTLLSAGCVSSRTETKKDLTVLQPGVAREAVIYELGNPATSTKSRAGLPVDVFVFVQGTAPSKKAPRPVEPEQADAVEILALLEQSGYSPTALLTGKKLTLQVNYDADERVTNTVLLRME